MPTYIYGLFASSMCIWLQYTRPIVIRNKSPEQRMGREPYQPCLRGAHVC